MGAYLITLLSVSFFLTVQSSYANANGEYYGAADVVNSLMVGLEGTYGAVAMFVTGLTSLFLFSLVCIRGGRKLFALALVTFGGALALFLLRSAITTSTIGDFTVYDPKKDVVELRNTPLLSEKGE